MKKHFWLTIALSAVVLAALPACRTETAVTMTTTKTAVSSEMVTVTTTTVAPPMPSDFYIVFESSNGLLLDTKKNVVGVTTSELKRVTANYVISYDDLQSIYHAFIEHDIASFHSSDIISDRRVISTPTITYTMTIGYDGKRYSVSYDQMVFFAPDYFPSHTGLAAFHRIVLAMHILAATDQSLPTDKPLLS